MDANTLSKLFPWYYCDPKTYYQVKKEQATRNRDNFEKKGEFLLSAEENWWIAFWDQKLAGLDTTSKNE